MKAGKFGEMWILSPHVKSEASERAAEFCILHILLNKFTNIELLRPKSQENNSIADELEEKKRENKIKLSKVWVEKHRGHLISTLHFHH
jgi:hypothetical protein